MVLLLGLYHRNGAHAHANSKLADSGHGVQTNLWRRKPDERHPGGAFTSRSQLSALQRSSDCTQAAERQS